MTSQEKRCRGHEKGATGTGNRMMSVEETAGLYPDVNRGSDKMG